MDVVSERPETSTTESTTTVVTTEESVNLLVTPVLRLRLNKPRSERKICWREDTIDNENMGKKKSKCCCIYKKPPNFAESSSEDEDECEHCFGHPEKRRKNHPHEPNKDPKNDDMKDNGREEHPDLLQTDNTPSGSRPII